MTVMLRRFLIVVWLFSSTDFCSTEEIIIERESWKDIFTVPPSKCAKIGYCATYNAEEDSQACRCYCPEQTGTFSIYHNRWTCLRNEVTRSHLGCSHRTLFLNETSNQTLHLLRSDTRINLSTLPERCRVNLQASWFIACDGKRVSLSSGVSKDAFDLLDQPSGYKLKLDLPDADPLLGRVVNLGIRCAPSGSKVEDSCLLFKLEGTLNCSATMPQTTESTIATSTTNVKSQFKVIEPSGRSFTASPSVNRPSAKATNGVKTKDGDFPSPAADRNSENGLISASVAGIIAGVNGFIILVMLVIGICIYRRNHSRSHPGRSISGGTAESFQSNSGFNTAETMSSYATVDRSDCGHYASIYRVPNGVRNDAPRSVEQPLYNIIEELATSNKQGAHENKSPAGLHDNAPFSVEQRVYGLIENIDPVIAQGPHENRSPIGHQDNAPSSVEQRVYSLIENIDTAIVKGPHDHGSSPEGEGNTASFSVDQRVYNIIEDLDSRLYEELNSFDPEQPEYHVLEGALPKGAEEADCVGSSDEHARSSV